MIALRPIYYSGQFLEPEHFDALVAYLAADVRRARGRPPASFGVVALTAHADVARTLEISEVELVLPGGEILHAGGSTGVAIPARRIEGSASGAIGVYVGLTRERSDAGNCSEGRDASRYAAVERRVHDWGDGKHSALVRLAAPRVQVRFDGESLDDFDAVRVLELRVDAAGRYVVDRGYVPPLVHVGASPHLLEALDGLLRRIEGCREHLDQRWTQVDGQSAALTAAAVTVALLRQLLGQQLPALWLVRRHAERVSPFELYVRLSGFAGQLAVLMGQGAAELPTFDPHDLRGTLDPVFKRLDELLQREPYRYHLVHDFAMLPGHPPKYALNLEHLQLDESAEYLLRVFFRDGQGRVTQNQDIALRELVLGAALGAPSALATAATNAYGGVPLHPVNAIPEGLPLHPGAGYFRLDPRSSRFRAMFKERFAHLQLAAKMPLPPGLSPYFSLIVVTR